MRGDNVPVGYWGRSLYPNSQSERDFSAGFFQLSEWGVMMSPIHLFGVIMRKR